MRLKIYVDGKLQYTFYGSRIKTDSTGPKVVIVEVTS